MTESRVFIAGLEKAETLEEQAKADDYKEQGNKVLAAKEYQQAVDLHTKAMEIDFTNVVYRTNRSAASVSLNDNIGARDDASVA